MKIKTSIILLFIFLGIVSLDGQDRAIETGLYFKSHTVLQENRTSFLPEEGKFFPLGQKLTFTFDINLRKERQVFGFIFRLINNNYENVDLVITEKNQESQAENELCLIVNNIKHPITSNIEFDKWQHVALSINETSDSLCVLFGDKKIAAKLNWDKKDSIKISFGKSFEYGFETNAVAPFDLKNVSIYTNNVLKRKWKLDKYLTDICLDSVQQAIAGIKNPVWIIDKHYQWREIYATDIQDNIQITHDAKKDIIYLVFDSIRVTRLNTRTLQKDIITVQGGVPAAHNFSQLEVDTINDRLVSFKIDEGKLSYFDIKTAKWTLQKAALPKSLYWHHSSIFNANDTSIVTFGGYGYHKYNNTLVSFDLNGNTSNKETIKEITPRYSPAIAILDNDIYIYGGRGSESGRQEMSTKYLYDLSIVDAATKRVKSQYIFAPDSINFLPASNMIYDRDSLCFYILTDYGGGQLMKLSLKDSTLTNIASTLPEPMSSRHIFRNLFYSPSLSKLYAVYDIYEEGQKLGKLKIFELNYPPLAKRDVEQSVDKIFQKDESNWTTIILITIIAILLMLIAYSYAKKRKKWATSISNEATEQIVNKKEQKSSINLLGGVRAIDSQGNYISDKFTPTLRELLLLLILHTTHNRKGILGLKIDETIWHDKSSDSARNNRYVTIRKLRLILSEVGDIEIKVNNEYCTILFGKDVYCDYMSLKQLLSDKSNLNKKECIHNIMAIVGSGSLLPNLNYEWLDPFKSRVSNEVVDFLNEVLEKKIFATDHKMLINIADSILSFDILNEEAMQIKCRALFQQGKKSLALHAYETFSKEYELLLGEKYPHPFNAITSEQTNR